MGRQGGGIGERLPGAETPAGNALEERLPRGAFPWTEPPSLRELGFVPYLRRSVRQTLIATLFGSANGFIVSYPKSGRTWLRFILANYLNRMLDLGLAIDMRTMFWVLPNDVLDRERGWPAYRFRLRREVPLLVMSHRMWWRPLFGRQPIVLLVREPKDTLVSLFFHMTRQNRAFGGNLKQFLRDPEHGVPGFCRYCNSWAEALPNQPHLVIAYERLRAAPEETLSQLLRFFDLRVEPRALITALQASTIDSMRAVEVRNGVPGHQYDRADQEGLRVRRGKVGGFRDYLDDADIAYVDRACSLQLSDAAKHLLGSVGQRYD